MYGHSRFFFWGDGGGNGGWWPSCPKNLHNARMYECWNGDAKAFKSPNETKTFTFQTAIPRGLKFLRDFNYFADFGFFEFRGNKFSRIWILNFTLGKMFLRISCAVLENDKHGSHMHGRFRYTVHNHFHWKSAMLIKRLDLCGLFWRQSVLTGFEFRRSIENPWNSQKLIDPTKYFMQHGNFKYSYIQGLHTHVNQSINPLPT